LGNAFERFDSSRRADIANRNDCLNDGTFASRDDLQLAADLQHPFSHASQTNVRTHECVPAGFLQKFGGNPYACISDFQGRKSLFHEQSNMSSPASGMAVNVCETFLEHAKHCQFRIRMKTAKVAISLERSFYPAACGKSIKVPTYRQFQARFLKKRRVHEIGNGAKFSQGLLQQARAFGEFPRCRWVGSMIDQQIQLESQAREILSETVVKFPADSSALLFLRADQINR
jgi:hypothetical protein